MESYPNISSAFKPQPRTSDSNFHPIKYIPCGSQVMTICTLVCVPPCRKDTLPSVSKLPYAKPHGG